MKYAAIAGWATDNQYPVTFMCAQLGVCRQGYYRWLRKVTRPARPGSARRIAVLSITSRSLPGDLVASP